MNFLDAGALIGNCCLECKKFLKILSGLGRQMMFVRNADIYSKDHELGKFMNANFEKIKLCHVCSVTI